MDETLYSYKQRLDSMSNFMLRALLEGLSMQPGRTRRAMIQQLIQVKRQSAKQENQNQEEEGKTLSHEVKNGATTSSGAAASSSTRKNASTGNGTAASSSSTTRKPGKAAGIQHKSTAVGNTRSKTKDDDPAAAARFFLEYCDPFCPVEEVVQFQELRFHRQAETTTPRACRISFFSTETEFVHIRCCRVEGGAGTDVIKNRPRFAWPANDVEIEVVSHNKMRNPRHFKNGLASSSGSNSEPEIDDENDRQEELVIDASATANPLEVAVVVPEQNGVAPEAGDDHYAVADAVLSTDRLSVRAAGRPKATSFSLALNVREPFFDDQASYFVMVCRGSRDNNVDAIVNSMLSARRLCVVSEEHVPGTSGNKRVHPESGKSYTPRNGNKKVKSGAASSLASSGGPSSRRKKRESTDSVILIQDEDADVCPLSLSEIQVAAVGSRCQHRFDLKSFLQYSQAKTILRRFCCPVCDDFLFCPRSQAYWDGNTTLSTAWSHVKVL
ncbi:unnamed protein product [Amoebophrya sp. A120]|nr:unnamed protein product [Amoebophrya sp. A120]|eukprot:GSA120T00005431001.1